MTESAPKSKAACPSCQSRFVIPDGMMGKKAKCPKCGQPFIITEEGRPKAPAITDAQNPMPVVNEVPPIAPSAANASPPQAVAKAVDSNLPKPSKKIEVPAWAITFGVPLLALTLGYFIGREHLKYQMVSALSGIGKEVSEGLNNIRMPPLPGPAADAPSEPLPSTPKISMGETYNAGNFTVTVEKAEVTRPIIKGLDDKGFLSDTEYLLISMLFENTSERKMLRFSAEKDFNLPRFKLQDDVDNVVRPIGFGIGNRPLMALKNMEDLKPKEDRFHVQAFEIPLPKTQSLTLTIDLHCFDGEGDIQVEIPYDQVQQPEP